MTNTEKMLEKFIRGLGGHRYREMFEVLESSDLRPLGKSNTETLLFQLRATNSETLDIFAFRLGPPPVISFPKSYWLDRPSELSGHLSNFTFSEKPAITTLVSDSQYSAGQVEITRSTHKRIIEVCTRVCASLR
ncbi:hypothetical protein [Pseudomonas sp. GV071]|uniref:hypothetical protein n=1 Tax=Pseudomonas sp. GV071 TaxID=2135754 RepID=UPI0011B22793|nr:hypothetical protein [Pseudomonas sp. GV071]